MERQHAKTIFFGTLFVAAVLALAYYFFVARTPDSGYRGILVEAGKWSVAGWRTLCSEWYI